MAFSPEGTAVCYRLVFEAVDENSVSKLQFVKSTFSEIELVNSLVQCNKEGETPMLIAMKMGNYSVIKEFVNWISEKHVYKKEKFEAIITIIIEQISRHIPLIDVIDHLIDDFSDGDWLVFIAQVFIKSTSLSQQDKIVALELIGSCLLIILPTNFDTGSLLGLSGLECWENAMVLRYFPTYVQPLLPKIPEIGVPSVLSSTVFESAVEVMTLEELQLLKEDFEQNYLSLDSVVRFPSLKRVQIQALLVSRRISTQANPGHPHRLYLNNLLGFGIMLMHVQENQASENNKNVINTCLFLLEQLSGFDPKLLCSRKFDVFLKTLGLLSICFANMLRAPPGSQEREELTYDILLMPTKFVTTIQWDYFENSEDQFLFGELVYLFLFILNFISPQLENPEKKKLKEYYSKYFLNFFPERTTTVLHVALSGIHYSNNFLDTIKMILKLGADPNAFDKDSLTPLHILAGIKQLHSEGYLLVFQTMVDAGSHLDVATDKGDTVLSILKRNVMECKEAGSIVDPYFESLLNTVFPLSCYCARVIRRNGIPFDGDRLPSNLQAFVQRHSAEELTG